MDNLPLIPPEPQNLIIIIFDSNHINRVISNVRVTVVSSNINPPQITVEPPSGPGEILDGTEGVQTLVNLRTPTISDEDAGVVFSIESKSSANGVFAVNMIDDHSVS